MSRSLSIKVNINKHGLSAQSLNATSLRQYIPTVHKQPFKFCFIYTCIIYTGPRKYFWPVSVHVLYTRVLGNNLFKQGVVVVVWFTTTYVPITIKVVRSNPAHGDVHSIHYVIKFVTDFCRSMVFSWYSGFFHQ